jgi:hypothetical protein
MARLDFTEGQAMARLSVFEHLRHEDDRARRLKYSYDVIVDGEPVVRFDRDPVAHPDMPEHKHVGGSEQERIP